MEIKNTALFLTGVIVLVLGMFVIVFDYPQIQYFEQMPPEAYYLLDPGKKDIHQRLLVEISIGAVVLSLGAGAVIFSLVKKNLRRLQ